MGKLCDKIVIIWNIINNFPDMDMVDKIGKTEYIYSSSYSNLDTLREEFFDTHNISFNINEFVRAQRGVLNSEVINIY